ncbi:MAG: response regulator [Deltaproteobacteria bacterium]|nr:response regulator [Deltaproteobacteria bacterium]
MDRRDMSQPAESKEAIGVLVIDDEKVFRDTLAKVLKRRGMAVKITADGFEGLALAQADTFDVAVLDLKMPGMDGLTVLERMHEICPSTEVVVLTGHATVEDSITAIRQFAFDFLFKPVEVSWLAEVIAAAARAKRAKVSGGTGGV